MYYYKSTVSLILISGSVPPVNAKIKIKRRKFEFILEEKNDSATKHVQHSCNENPTLTFTAEISTTSISLYHELELPYL